MFNQISQGNAVAQSVERAIPGEEVRVRFPLWPPDPYWFGLCQYTMTGRDRSHGLPTLSRVWQNVKLSDVSLGTRPRYSPVVDKDFKKPTNQTNQPNVKGLIFPSPGCPVVARLSGVKISGVSSHF